MSRDSRPAVGPVSQAVGPDFPLRAMELSAAATIVVGVDGSLLWFNEAVCRLLGRTADQVRHLAWGDLLHPDDMQRFVEAAQPLLEGDADAVRIRHPYFRPGSEPVWGDVTLTAVRDDGELKAVLAQVVDVTDQVCQEESLLASWSRYHAAVDSMLDAFVVLTAVRDASGAVVDFTFTEANAQACIFNGCTREELIGASLLQRHPAVRATGLLDSYIAVTESREPLVLDDWAYPQDLLGGEVRRYDVRISPAGDGVCQTWRDVTDRWAAQQRELRLRDDEFRLMAENSSDIVALAIDGRYAWVSPSLTTVLGWDPADWVGKAWNEFIHPDDLDLSASRRGFVLAGGTGRTRVRVRDRAGVYHWVDVNAGPRRDADGAITGGVGSMRLVDDDVAAEQALHDAQERYRIVVENASDVVLEVGPDDRLAWAAESLTRTLGWAPGEVIGRHVDEFIHPDDRPITDAARNALKTGLPTSIECRLLREDGTWRWMALRANPVEGPGGQHRIIAARDIEPEVAMRKALQDATGRDHLTGLPTRAGLLAHGEAEATTRPLRPRMIGMLDVGIDQLSEINDALSFSAGDLILMTVAARITRIAGPQAYVARGTGVDFLVRVDGGPSAADLEQLAERLRRAVAEPIEVMGHTVHATATVGAALEPVTTDLGPLVHAAALAMRRAKEQGRDRTAFADPAMAEDARARLLIAEQVRQALRGDQFTPWYQPIVDLASGELVGYEALVRWDTGDRGIVMPDQFIPAIERTPLIDQLDLRVAQHALGDLAGMRAPLFLSINVSAHSLADTHHVDSLLHAIEAAGIDPAWLHLEITETTLLGLSDKVLAAVHRVAGLGCRWYVDDFGTGYSSIAHLRDLPVAGVKLDGSFTAGIADGDETCIRLAQGLAGLAQGLGLDTIAEGVETPVEAAILSAQGWRRGQGWLYGKAAPL